MCLSAARSAATRADRVDIGKGTPMATRIEERANPAAVGFRWFSEGGTEYEIVWPRTDARDWTIGARPDGSARWVHYGTAPGIPRAATLKEARAVARAFIDAP